MTVVRAPALAGQFYPADPQKLSADITRYLADAQRTITDDLALPKAIIAPHAGYVFSGSVAASAYARVLPLRDQVRRVVLLGPCHRVPVRSLALSGAEAFETPFGRIPVDRAAEALIMSSPHVEVKPDAHLMEHSLEVHLPFLQAVLGQFSLVPIVVGAAPPEVVAEVLDRLWGGPETLIVVSTDLSHFLDYQNARSLDQRTKLAIEQFNIDGIGDQQACGRFPVRGLLRLAKQRGMTIKTVDFRNSGDTAGDKSRVVGYGSWLLMESDAKAVKATQFQTAVARPAGSRPNASTAATATAEDSGIAAIAPFAKALSMLLDKHGESLIRLAAKSIEAGLATAKPCPVTPPDYDRALQQHRACFVTLNRQGRLRGCIGSLQARQPLLLDVAENAFKAAFHDPRFPQLESSELASLHIHISVLSPAVTMQVTSEADLLGQLRPRVDGLIIADAGRQAVFLPTVWQQIPDPRQFLLHLKRKAGMADNHWSDSFRAWRFITEGVSLDRLADPQTVWSAHRH